MHLELSDQTFIAAAPAAVARVVADPRRWPVWWPDLELALSRDRGVKGQQWVLIGRIGGTAEIYLEPWHDGTVLHLFLRLTLATAPRGQHRQLAWKQSVHQLKDELEAGRVVGAAAQVDSGS